MKFLQAVCLLLVCGVNVFASYPALPVPPKYAGNSGERGQILVDGIVTKVTLLHGSSDDEADWHVFIDISQEASYELAWYLRARNIPVDETMLDVLYSELMTLDKYSRSWWDDKFYPADFTSCWLLSKPGSTHPAWDLGVFAVNNQGSVHDFSSYSKLIRARAYLQGSFVNDTAHGPVVIEIHPLDSISFAMDINGTPIAAKRGQPGWPTDYVRWRVGVFANSSFHRINNESYVNKERTTTWYLDLPTKAIAGGATTPGNITVTEERQSLWHGGWNNWYSGSRWKTLVPWTIAKDPKDGRKKLKVTTTMWTPDKFGGIIVRDFIIKVNTLGNTNRISN